MFSMTELIGMRECQKLHMMDTCVIYHVTSKAKNARGESVKTFDDGTESICGLQMSVDLASELNYGGSFIEADIDAVLRLPLTVVCNIGDEVEITHRFGEELMTPMRYEVERFLNDGVSGCRAYLKLRAIA